MSTMINKLVRDEQGQDVVEYAVLVAGIGLVIFAGAETFGTQMNLIYGRLSAAVDAMIP